MAKPNQKKRRYIPRLFLDYLAFSIDLFFMFHRNIENHKVSVLVQILLYIFTHNL